MKSVRYIALAAGALAVMGTASQAMASTSGGSRDSCSDLVIGGATNASAYGPGSSYGTYASTYDSCLYGNTANQNSTVATANAVLQAASSQAARLIGNRVSSALSGGGAGFNVADNGFSASSGVAAGGMENRMGVWVSGSYSDVSDDNTATAFDGTVYTGFAGVDYKVTNRALVGLSVGYEDADIDTAYNQSSTGADGNVEGDGYTIAPYLGVELGKNASFSLTGGYADLEYDTLRYDPISSNSITGSTDAERWFVSGALNGAHKMASNWNLRGRLSAFYADEEKDAFTETESDGATIDQGALDNAFGQASLEARLGYAFRYAEPYVLAAADYDFEKDEAPVGLGTSLAPAQQKASLDDSDFGARFGGGLNFQLGSNVTGGIEAYTVEFREDYEEITVGGGLRLNF
ncbi:MAG: autotransporter outer membrane beta-barrel domain-containing protein [Alphaproteobacteria bacterium]|nr:autotransporter outer membrane beta-barrel domain-containing protein [Alphaproteobacteria bacterium]